MLGTTHWSAGVRSMRAAQKKNPWFRAETAGSARGCRASASGRRGGGAPSHEGVVHRDCDVERRAPAAVTLGQRVRDALPRKPMMWTEPSPAAEWRRVC